eukprot:371879_1
MAFRFYYITFVLIIFIIMGKTDSDAIEREVASFFGFIPIIGTLYEGVAAAVYAGKGNMDQAKKCGKGMGINLAGDLIGLATGGSGKAMLQTGRFAGKGVVAAAKVAAKGGSTVIRVTSSGAMKTMSKSANYLRVAGDYAKKNVPALVGSIGTGAINKYGQSKDDVGVSQCFIVSNKKSFSLAFNDDNKVVTTKNLQKNGWEGIRIELSEQLGVYFITSNKNKNVVLACNDDGGITTTGNRFSNGWEGWKLEHVGDNVYFLISNKKGYTLAISDDGTVQTTKNKQKYGWEGMQLRC